MKKSFEFMDNGQSVNIYEINVPRPWMNYLWNDDGYMTKVSHVGASNGSYRSPENIVSNLCEEDSKFFYLRDDENNVSWSPTYYPLNTSLDEFHCTHNLSYTRMYSLKDGIASNLTVVLPRKGTYEIWKLEISNITDRSRKISVFATTRWDVEGFKHPKYFYNKSTMTCEFNDKLNGVFAKADHLNAPHKRFKAFISSSEQIFAYDSMVRQFYGGGAGSFHKPITVVEGLDCKNSNSMLWDSGGILQNKLEIQPGETKTIFFSMGFCESLEEALEYKSNQNEEFFLNQIKMTSDFWNEIINKCYIETPDTRVNNVMNIWAKKQMIFCRFGKKGVRDNMQIADGLLQIWPEGGRAEILEVISHQFKDGHTVLCWDPYDDTHYSDQPIWLVMGVSGYIKETGDFSILNEIVPYEDGGSGTVWEHLKAGLNLKLNDTGEHGICKLRYADWNDALQIISDPEAESVFVSMGVCYMLSEIAEIAKRIGETEFAEDCLQNHNKVAENINKVAWEGEHYTGLFYKCGELGSRRSYGSKMFANPQTWAIMGKVVTEEKLPSLLKAMDKNLEHEFGLPVNWPPYEGDMHILGRQGSYPPGVYENGGVYCHATGFALVANGMARRGDVAYRLLSKIIPDAPNNPSIKSGAEPYVFTNSYFTSKTLYGVSTGSWMTGTSVWCFKGLVEWILGVRRTYEGLMVDPQLPTGWKKVKVKRSFRGSIYNIEIENPDNVTSGKINIIVDGLEYSSQVLPVFSDGKEHSVKVYIQNENL